MTEPTWLPLELKTNKVNAKPDSIWTLVCEYIKGPMKLKIEASGTWEYSPTKECGADGVRQAGVPTSALNNAAPLGALIAKIGGSPADISATSFIVGSYVILPITDANEGALFLTMNDQIDHFDDHGKELTIVIQQARS